MSLSRASLIDRAYLRNQSKGGAIAAIPLGRYDAMEPQARTSMARKVAANANLRGNLQKNFSLSVVSGAVSLAPSLVVAEPLILETLQFARIISAESSQPWQWLPDYAILSLKRPQYGLIHFAVDAQTLYATDTFGDIGVLSTTATATASFIPLTATISGNLNIEELLISELAMMVIGGETQIAAA